MRTRAALAISVLIVSSAVSHATDVFSFAGFTFNQTNTPNEAILLGNGVVLGGATFSPFLPNDWTDAINFPQGGPTFNSALSLGQLVGFSTVGVRAINLPRGNNGTATRHGVEVSWTNAAPLRNLAGPDFVIYESGSTSNAVEGVMARVRTGAEPETWSDWYYFAPDGYQLTTSSEVAFSYGFDLSEMGVPAFAQVDRIQMANLTAADRIDTTNTIDVGGGVLVGQGRVVFGGSPDVRPDAGSFDSDRVFDSGTYDPDPLYVAILNSCDGETPSLTVMQNGGQILVSWPAPSCFSLQRNSSLPGSWADAEDSLVVTNGNNVVTLPMNGVTGFFRLVKN